MSKSSNEELFNRFASMSTLQDMIIDRYIYSNLVYASLYEDYSIISTPQKLDLEDRLLKNQALIVYLYSDVEVLKDRLNKRGDEYVHEDRLESINDKYTHVLKKSHVPILYINTELMTSEQISQYIYRLIG
ncbi:deoxynucleoside kinase [Brevibacillus sp. NRS-1366]|uniref:deoxynucleoside kinase n=1 Tax=Brevibacillus sp. NRS-1366 TaxID=3233899 RepID=UPI003D1E2A5B